MGYRADRHRTRAPINTGRRHSSSIRNSDRILTVTVKHRLSHTPIVANFGGRFYGRRDGTRLFAELFGVQLGPPGIEPLQ